MGMELTALNRAIEFAAQAHRDQNYASGEDIPQIAHPYFVALTLLRHGFPTDVVCAGVLHDVVEDTPYTLDDIEKRFGEKVREYVEGVTFDQSLAWEERQRLAAERMQQASREVRAIKTADILHHLVLFTDRVARGKRVEEIVAHTTQKTLWKYDLLLRVIEKHLQHPLVDEAWEEYAKLKDMTS